MAKGDEVVKEALVVILDAEVADDSKRRDDTHYSNGDDSNYENAHSSDVHDNSVHADDEQVVSVAAAGYMRRQNRTAYKLVSVSPSYKRPISSLFLISY